MRQSGGGVCRLSTPIARSASPEEGSMEKSLSYQARCVVLQQMAPQYRQASPSQKRTLLESFVATTGYVRKYTRWLLNHAEEVQQMWALTCAQVWTRRPARAVPGLERRQPHLRQRKRRCNFHSVNAELPHLLRRSLQEQDHDPPTFDDGHGTLKRLSVDGVQHRLHLGTLRQRGMFRSSILGGMRGKRWLTRDVL